MHIYRLFSILLFPLIELYLFFRVFKKKEDKTRLKERFGHSTKNRPEGQIIWIHAVSVGETNSALILVEELLKSSAKISILFTTTTLTSASIIAAKLSSFNGRLIHQFLPVDSYFCVKNFLDFWKFRVAIFVESEIWPNLISEARKMEIPVFLVNARMSEKSFKKWHLAKKIGFKLFNNFSAIFAQTAEDQKRFQRLSNCEILSYGNLKSEAQNLLFDVDELNKLKLQIGARKFWLASSTHKGEEEIILKTHALLKNEFPNILTILVPRHPNRAEEIKLLMKGLNFVQRSKKEEIVDSSEVYLADSLGELGIFYRLAPFAFIGGSLLEIGGHNPFEAIKLDCAVVSGGGVFNFKEIYQSLAEANACLFVNSESELAELVKKLLLEERLSQELSKKASQLLKTGSENIAEKIVKKLGIF